MPRGRQYYDPILQVPGKVEVEQDLSRIELYPETGDPREETAQPGKWKARKINPDGTIAQVSKGDFDRDRAQNEAEGLWPGLMVHELRSEFEDSTWAGIGPSPRVWQGSPPEIGAAAAPPATSHSGGPPPDAATSGAGGEHLTPAVEETVALRVFPITETGTYVLLEDMRALLEMWAVAYEIDKNPSAALALRDAVDVLRDVG